MENQTCYYVMYYKFTSEVFTKSDKVAQSNWRGVSAWHYRVWKFVLEQAVKL